MKTRLSLSYNLQGLASRSHTRACARLVPESCWRTSMPNLTFCAAKNILNSGWVKLTTSARKCALMSIGFVHQLLKAPVLFIITRIIIMLVLAGVAWLLEYIFICPLNISFLKVWSAVNLLFGSILLTDFQRLPCITELCQRFQASHRHNSSTHLLASQPLPFAMPKKL